MVPGIFKCANWTNNTTQHFQYKELILISLFWNRFLGPKCKYKTLEEQQQQKLLLGVQKVNEKHPEWKKNSH